MSNNLAEDNNVQLATPVDERRDHAKGPSNAPVTLVEYGDFECPDCGAVYPTINELEKRMGNHLRFVYRYYPLVESHPHAEHAAEVAEAAAAQGKFWEMYDKLYQNQRHLSDNNLMQYAESIGLDTKLLDREMQNGTYTKRIEDDLDSGDQSGLAGTPTFYINGKYYDGVYNVDAFQEALEQAANGK
ncbi:MAG: hypothetical protein NVS4B11_36250 [Ktedonobacteraceae bacterium]